VFIRPELVVEPGLQQLTAALLTLVATIGITFSMQASFADRAVIDWPVRFLLAVTSIAALLHPNNEVAALICIPIGLTVGYWLLRRRVLAEPQPGAPAAHASPAIKTGQP
jgi:predicted ABC-type sugar transport system permease subunit